MIELTGEVHSMIQQTTDVAKLIQLKDWAASRYVIAEGHYAETVGEARDFHLGQMRAFAACVGIVQMRIEELIAR